MLHNKDAFEGKTVSVFFRFIIPGRLSLCVLYWEHFPMAAVKENDRECRST